MKFVVVPDSFKGTLSSAEICETVKSSIEKEMPEASVTTVPIADGGEGSADAFLSISGGEKVYVKVPGPLFDETKAFYALSSDGKTAVIEMAACAGLPLVENRKKPLETTTYGVGQLINDAARKGAKRIILCLGGSATNEAGCGAACACGVEFFNKKGEKFVPVGRTLSEIERIDRSNLFNYLKGIEFITMCDVKNTMFGPGGASQVFGPQKGASKDDIALLEKGIIHLCKKVKSDLGTDISYIEGSGAAGGMGGGTVAFFGSVLKPGIDTLLDFADFDSIIKDADYIITGEGRIDGQSIRGKVISGVAARAKKQNVPVIVLAGGALDKEIERMYDLGVTGVFTINRLAEDFKKSAPKSAENLAFTVKNIIKLIKTKERI